MPIISPDLFDKLANISISKRDRQFIYVAFGLAWVAVAYLVWRGTDNELHRIAMNGMLWLIAALVILFVAAGVAKRGQAGSAVKAVVPATPAPSPVEINFGTSEGAKAPPEMEKNVEIIKKDVKVIKKRGDK